MIKKPDNKKFSVALKRGIDDLTSCFNIFVTDLTILNAKVSALDDSLSTAHSSLSITDVITEVAKREKCKSIIIIHCLRESKISNIATKLNEDKKNLDLIF